MLTRNPSRLKLDEYLNNFKEAYLQIAETVKTINASGKIIIKLILHFEKLVQLLADNEEIFNKIIETKIEYEDNAPIAEGREFQPIIDRIAKLNGVRFLDRYDYLFGGLFKGL